jgi:hypothetical protein
VLLPLGRFFPAVATTLERIGAKWPSRPLHRKPLAELACRASPQYEPVQIVTACLAPGRVASKTVHVACGLEYRVSSVKLLPAFALTGLALSTRPHRAPGHGTPACCLWKRIRSGQECKRAAPSTSRRTFFRDYVVPEMTWVLRGDERSCMHCHGEPGRVPSMELHRPDQVGYLPVDQLLDNYATL